MILPPSLSNLEVVVVTCTTEGDFVGVSANVDESRVEAILRAAATREEHVDHPEVT